MEIKTMLRKQAEEIADEGHAGWGNTMTEAADRLAALEAKIEESERQHTFDEAEIAAQEERVCEQLGIIGALEAENAKRRDFMQRAGYRPCDIPQCNCDLWHHGHADERLRELSDELGDLVQGQTMEDFKTWCDQDAVLLDTDGEEIIQALCEEIGRVREISIAVLASAPSDMVPISKDKLREIVDFLLSIFNIDNSPIGEGRFAEVLGVDLITANVIAIAHRDGEEWFSRWFAESMREK